MSEPDAAALYAEHADRLRGIAYRMVGEVGEAQDAVHDAFERWEAADRSDVREPGAWLTTVVTRTCLDRLRSARHRRETYVGPWLPEPLPTDELDPADIAEMGDSLTFAFLVLLERLSPLERVVLVLHDVFGHPHAEVAAMLDRAPAAVRQAASRARRHVRDGRARFEPDRDQHRLVTERFLDACASGDVDAVVALLAPDVQFVGDGGGVVTAVREPVVGAERVARMLVAFWRTGARRPVVPTVEIVELNTSPGVRIREGGVTTGVFVLDLVDGVIADIRGVRNPAKLAHLERPGPG